MLTDLLAAAGQRPEGSAGTKAGRSRPRAQCEPDALPLVEEDGLYFRVVAGGHTRLRCDRALIAEKFREAFASVWAGLPAADRGRLTAHWRHHPEARLLAARERTDRPGPLIRVVCGPALAEVTFAGCGTEIGFPAHLAAGPDDRLRWEIARALGQVCRLASGEHWKLIVEVIEEPLARWERQEGAGATHARRGKRLDALEAAYSRRFEASLGRVLRRWKVAPPQAEGSADPGVNANCGRIRQADRPAPSSG